MSTSRTSTSRKHRVTRAVVATTLAVGGTMIGSVVAAGSSQAATASCIQGPSGACISSADGSYVQSIDQVDNTTYDLNIYSAAMKTTLHARAVIPNGYLASPASTTYPVMYLLSGSSADNSDWKDWTAAAPIESFIANGNYQVLTVMPEDGNAGEYTDWIGNSKVFTNAKPAWETFHTAELPQILQNGFRASTTAVIAGISEAGIGVIDYPARHPGEYKAAASFSGMLNTQVPGSVATIQASEVRASDSTTGPFGDPVFNNSTWSAHNPVKLISAFAKAGTALWLSSGNGNPGPYDDGSFKVDSFVYEQNALSQAKGFAEKARDAGVKVTTDFYGNGTHNWPSWVHAFPNAWTTTLAPGLGIAP